MSLFLQKLKKSFRRMSNFGGRGVDTSDDEFSTDGETETQYSEYGDYDRRLMYPRAKLLWENVSVQQISRLLGIKVHGSSEEDIKIMLRKKRVWPYYYPDPKDASDNDRFPVELLPEFKERSCVPVSNETASVNSDAYEPSYIILAKRRPTLRSKIKLHGFVRKKSKSLRQRLSS